MNKQLELRKKLFELYGLDKGDEFHTKYDDYTVSKDYKPLLDIYMQPDDGLLSAMINGEVKITKGSRY